MNIVNIIEGIERLVVSLLFWLIFIPKSLFKIVSDPRWVEEYVTRELKEDADRFQDYMSPIILYLLNSVFLVFIYIFLRRDVLEGDGSSGSAEATSIWEQIVARLDISGDMITNLSGSNGFVAAAVFLTFPLSFALIIELCKRAGLHREALRRATYIQCYYFSPLALTFCLIILSSSLLEPLEQNLIVGNFLVFFVWFSLAQVNFIASELRKKTKISGLIYLGIYLGITGGFYGVSYVVAVFDEDKNRLTGDSYDLPEVSTDSVSYLLIVNCQSCMRSTSDSLVLDAVLTTAKGKIENMEIRVPVRKENEKELKISGEYNSLKLEASENLGHDLSIDILDAEEYSIIGGIKSRKAMWVRKIVSYILLALLIMPLGMWLKSLIVRKVTKNQFRD